MSAPMDEPLSWLTLELYALDELSPPERRRVEARLAASARDRACLAQILADRSELPPLPSIVVPHRRGGARRKRLLLLTSSIAAAAALALALLREPALTAQRYVSDGVKGGEVALLLHGERSGEAPRSFAQGERFKVFATCPPWFAAPLALLVFQGDERYAPLGPAQPRTCGNRVPLAGAFALDGDERAIVCLSWSEASERARRASELGDRAVCTELAPR